LNVCCNTVTCLACLARCGKVNASLGKKLYFVLSVLAVILALLLRYNAFDWFSQWAWVSYLRFVSDCKKPAGLDYEIGTSDPRFTACLRNQAVYRVGFTLTTLATIAFLFSLLGKQAANGIHRNAWALKFVLLPILTMVWMFVPNSVFDGFSEACVYLSFIFIIIQLVSIVDFAYTINESLVEKYQETEKTVWLVLLIAGSVILVLSSWTGVALIYVYYTATLSKWVNSVTFVVGLLLAVFAATPWCPHGSLLTSACVMAYTTFTTWAAVVASPDYRDEEAKDSGWRLALGLILASLSLGWSSYSLASQPDLFHVNGANSSPPAADSQRETNVVDVGDKSGEEGDEETGTSTALQGGGGAAGNDSFESLLWFNFVMVTASFYITMLCSNWKLGSAEMYGRGWSVFWVQICGTWAVLLLYLWTLVAPIVFPERDF